MSSSLPDEAVLSRMSHEELWRLFPIILSGSREEWAELYRRERDLLAEAVDRTHIARISHIGSTAVPGLDAKPTIDILMEVSPDSFVFKTPPLLRKCGYMETHRDEERMGLVMVKGYTAEGFQRGMGGTLPPGKGPAGGGRGPHAHRPHLPYREHGGARPGRQAYH